MPRYRTSIHQPITIDAATEQAAAAAAEYLRFEVWGEAEKLAENLGGQATAAAGEPTLDALYAGRDLGDAT